MSADKFNNQASTPAEHLSNCRFQLENIEGYLDFSPGMAAAKAKCLLDAAGLLVAAFEAEARKTPEAFQ